MTSTRIHYWPRMTSQSPPFSLRFWDEKSSVHGSFTTCFTLKEKRLLELCDAFPAFCKDAVGGIMPQPWPAGNAALAHTWAVVGKLWETASRRKCLHFITIYKGKEVWNNWQAWSWVPRLHFELPAIPIPFVMAHSGSSSVPSFSCLGFKIYYSFELF